MSKLPQRLQLAIAFLIAGGVTITQEAAMAPLAHKIILLAGGVVLYLLNPSATSPAEALEHFPPAGANQTPIPPAL
jgi:hypothetical protein